MRMGIIEKFWRLEYPYSHYREWYYEFNKYTIIRWFVISEIMNSLFTTLMLLGSVTVLLIRQLFLRKIIVMIKLAMLTIAMNPLKNVHLYGKAMILLKVLVTMKLWNRNANGVP